MISSNGFRRLLFFKSFSEYSTTSTTTAAAAAGTARKHHKSNFLEDYLINTIGFSKEQALSAATKARNSTFSRNDPDSVVNFLQKLGLNKTHIKSIVYADPRLLSYNADKTLLPKIKVLQDLGISRSDVVKVLMNYKSFLRGGLNSQIIPRINYLRNLLGSDENVAEVIKKYTPLLCDSRDSLVKNVELLQKAGFSKENISKFIVKNPRIIMQKPGWLEEILHKAEYDLGIPRDSKMFYHGVRAVSGLTNSKLDLKLAVLRSFGWSVATVYRTVRKYPPLLGTSDDKINTTSKFFINELGYAPDYLAVHPILFKMNFKKRVKPRIEVLKILNEMKLNKSKRCLYTVLCMPEEKFVNEYLLPYKDEIPDMCDAYYTIVGKSKNGKF